MTRTRGQSGFTLVELLVVIAIMAVLAAIAVPAFYQWNQNLRYKEAAWGINSQMRQARQMALTNNREFRVELDLDAKQYRLTQGNLPSGSTAWAAVTPWSAIAAEVSWNTGAACDGTADLNVEFNPNGTADAAGVCIKDSSGAVRYRVTVSQTSGRVSID